MIHSPFFRLGEDVLQLYGGFAQIVVLVEISGLGDGEAELDVGSGEDFVLDHFEFDHYGQFGKLYVGHLDGLLLVYDQLDEYFGWGIIRQLKLWYLDFDLAVELLDSCFGFRVLFLVL